MDSDYLVTICLERLSTRYTVLALFLGGSAVNRPGRALDADVCAIVREDAMERARVYVAGVPVDVFVCGAERLDSDLKKGGLHQHVVRLFATGKHLYGDKSVSDASQSSARRLLRGPAPVASKHAVFAHRSRPFNLLRKFRDVCDEDSATAGLIVAELVQSSVEAYFALNRIWTIGIRERMSVIADHNAPGANALRQVIEAPLTTLCQQPQLLEEMVHLLVGAEPETEDVWLG